ncbi:hypothetical protein F5Y17DRAFT_471013 [Xylariaceae sp. FL0594]|nr:hypothetical protein F5Y17DRAFT_471013 [Xylariaceae sp. FL0594]
MLKQAPTEADVTKRAKELPPATPAVHERHIEYLIDKLCAGAPAEQAARFCGQKPGWTKAIATACVNLAKFLDPVVALTAGRLDTCWKRLLLSTMRRRPRGLLDMMGETH